MSDVFIRLANNQTEHTRDLPTVCGLTTLSPATIYRRVKKGDFPAPVRLGKLNLWRLQDVQDWLNGKPTASQGGQA